MNKFSKSTFALLGALIFGLVCSISARASDFTGRVIVRMQDEVDTMRVLVKGDQYLLQRTVEGDAVSVLVDRTAQKMDAWSASENDYHESGMQNPLVAMLDPFSTVEATSTLSEGASKKVGTETIQGYACDKFVLSEKDGTELVDYWRSKKLGFPLKIVVPMKDGMTLEVSQITEAPVDASLFQVPAGRTLAVEPGAAPPSWAGDVAAAPLVTIPYQHVMSAGEIIRVKPRIGQKIEVECSDAAAMGAQFCGVPFKDGKPSENYMQDTFKIDPGDHGNWTKPFDPFSSDEDELVIRMNKGRGLIVVRPAKN